MSKIPPSSVRVRHPGEKDINALASLFSDARKDTETFQKRHQLLYREIQISKSPHKFFLLIEYEGSVAGFIRMARSKNPFARTWWIAGLEIYPDLKRKGLGTYLVKEALYAVYHRGCTRVALKVEKTNPDARKFYEALNFKKGGPLFARIISLCSRRKDILMIDLDKNRNWLNRPQNGYKYMGIK